MLQVYKRTIGEQEIYLQADQAFEKEANTVLDFVELNPGEFNFIFSEQMPATGGGCGTKSSGGGCGSGGCSTGGCGTGSSSSKTMH